VQQEAQPAEQEPEVVADGGEYGVAGTDRARLINSARASLPPSADGSIRYSARANAMKATVAG